jgi:hypothetical protein
MDRRNGNHDAVSFLVNLRRFPERKAELIKKFNDRRLARVLKARATRPIVLPISFTNPAPGLGIVSPISNRTNRLNYPAEILAAVHNFDNTPADQLAINRNGDVNLGILSAQDSIKFNLQDWAGPVGSGPAYFPAPIALGRGERLYVDYFRPLGVLADQFRHFCFVGQRTYPANTIEGSFSDQELTEVRKLIDARLVPEVRVMSLRVDYPSAAANVEAREQRLPGRQEPLLILAMRSTGLRHSLFTISFEGEEPWMPAPAPVWSLMNSFPATGNKGLDTNWQFLETPIYLPARQDLIGNFISSGDDESGTFDQDNAGNDLFLTVSFLAVTM